MFAHEIKVRGGFDSSYFLDRHFSQECVRGSLVGWNEPKTDFIEGLIGLEYEEIESNSKPVHTTEALENKDTVDQSSASVLSMKQSGGVKPLGKKQISNILLAVTGGYNSSSCEQQFQISGLVM